MAGSFAGTWLRVVSAAVTAFFALSIVAWALVSFVFSAATLMVRSHSSWARTRSASPRSALRVLTVMLAAFRAGLSIGRVLVSMSAM